MQTEVLIANAVRDLESFGYTLWPSGWLYHREGVRWTVDLGGCLQGLTDGELLTFAANERDMRTVA